MTTASNDSGRRQSMAPPPDHTDQLDDATWAAALRLVLDAPADAHAWAGHDLARVALVRDLEAITHAVRALPRPDTEDAWTRFRAEIEAARQAHDRPDRVANEASARTTPARERAGRGPGGLALLGWRRWVAPTGAALALGCLGVIAFRALRHDTDRHAARVTVYQTPVGHALAVTLPDGSRATLASQTTLRVDDAFGASTRAVTVTGHVVFSVAHSGGAPFVVRSGGVSARVLGATFSVRHYADDRDVQIAVATGKVAVALSETQPASVTLVANMIAQIADSAVLVTKNADLASDTAWMHGTLAFDGAPAGDVLKTIGRWYGYEFQWRDSTLAGRPLTARFAGESTEDVLRTLSTLLDVTMHFDGHVVTLVPARHSASPATKTRAPRSPLVTDVEVGR